MPQPLSISHDWLSFSVKLHLTEYEKVTGHAMLTPPPEYTLMELGGTNLYKRRLYVMTDHGDKVLTLLLEPHSKQIPQDSMFVEVANPLLYSNRGLQWIPKMLFDIHSCEMLSLSRLDAAIDFNPTAHQYATIEGLMLGTIYVQGKQEGGQFHRYRRVGKVIKTPKQLTWGHKTSDMSWKLYNKTLEITETDRTGKIWCTKPYIRETWDKCGLDTSQDVWRLEVSLKGSSSYNWRGGRMDWNLTHPDVMTAWAWDMVATRFTMRANEGHSCRKNDTLVDFLPIPPDDERSRLTARVGGDDTKHPDHISTLRALVKELDRPEVQAAPLIRQPIMDALEAVLTRAKLHGYFARVTGQTWEEYTAAISYGQG